MIHYHLVCSAEHVFDDWFSNSADFDAKKEAGALRCPICGDTHIEKTIMAPNVGSSSPGLDLPPCAGGSDSGGCCSGGCPMMG